MKSPFAVRRFIRVAVVRAILTVFALPLAHGDTFYVSNFGNSTISKIDSAGTVTQFATVNQKPYGMAFSRFGELFVVSAQLTNRLSRIALDGTVTPSTQLQRGWDATDIAFSRDGILYLALQSGMGIWRAGGNFTPVASGFESPFGMAFDRSGNLFVGDLARNSISKVAPNGTVTPFATNVTQCFALAFDAQGNLYASSASKIEKFTAAGERSTFANGFGWANGIAFDTAGDLYVVDNVQSAVMRITPDGVVHPFAKGGFSVPQYIVVEPDFAPPTVGIEEVGKVRVAGGINLPYVVLRSEEFVTWTPVATNSVTASGSFDVVDADASNAAARFYRARLR
jgi:sugar lactone lactonase YvrE